MADYTRVVGNAIKPRSSRNYDRTVIQLDNPASENCILTHVYCHARGVGSGKVKIFRDDGTNFVLVAELAISNVGGDNIHEVNLPVEKGDYIAYYFSGGNANGVPNCDSTGSSAYVDGDVTGQRAKADFRFRPQSSDIHAGYSYSLFQYQLIFRQADLPDAYRRGLLDEEYRKYAAVSSWHVLSSDPDCFDTIRPNLPAGDGISRTGWLCRAVEFGPSGCWPLPWWACPGETERTIYFRGECSCDHFRKVLQPLGLPCYHLIKAKAWYGSTVPYCPYIQCD